MKAIDIIKRSTSEGKGEITRQTGPTFRIDEKERKDFEVKFGKTICFLDMLGLRGKMEELRDDLLNDMSPAQLSVIKSKLDAIQKYVNVFKTVSDSINRNEKTIIRETEETVEGNEGKGDGVKIEIVERINYDTLTGKVE